ncbi:GIY-YIG nuclease family protein [Dongia sp.]|uniref:GIY-YIG nuclease family protein n=1 Tax=Dongia sp. TaxID=1977262 RepID=UPI0035B17E81
MPRLGRGIRELLLSVADKLVDGPPEAGHDRNGATQTVFAAAYIMTDAPHGTLYVGVTTNLVRRIAQHRAGEIDGFTKRYGLKRLVYFEAHDDINAAIHREKRLKKWPRAWKVRLIAKENPDWRDLYDELFG